MPRDKTVSLLVLTNPDQLILIKVFDGHCRLVGRKTGDETTVQIQAGGLRLVPPEALGDMQDRLSSLKELEGSGLQLDPEAYPRQPDAIIDDPTISTHHVMFYNNNGELALVDMGSKNGTIVNGQQVMACQLKHGDLISIGNTKLRVE